MRARRSRFLPALVAAVALASGTAGLAACGDDDDASVVTTAAGATTTVNPITDVDVQQANALIASTPNLSIIDVRTPEEFATGHIDRAANIDVEAPDFTSLVERLPRDRPTLVYCRSGNRSAQAAAQMAELGFIRLYNMTGGMNEWTAAGFPVVTG